MEAGLSVRRFALGGTGTLRGYSLKTFTGERMALGPRLIYVSYGDGIGKSKLKLPAIKQGTARNMNSVAKIAELLAGME